jgi:hypothetical protein
LTRWGSEGNSELNTREVRPLSSGEMCDAKHVKDY